MNRTILCYMTQPATLNSQVIVGAKSLDDMLELARLAAARLGDEDPLAKQIQGVTAELRTHSRLER